ncbi:MAG: peptidyl-tRNA hydrolase [Dermatophilaceae bacterium]
MSWADGAEAVDALDAACALAAPVSRWADLDDPGPWAMQLALRYDPSDLPSHTRMCAAAARAVVSLLADERSRGAGEWAPYVHRWRDGRIRKLARRARGVRWDRVQELPGVTVVEGPAQVRAFVPRPARPLPDALNALQVSGTNYPRSPRADEVPTLGAQDGCASDRTSRVVMVALTPYAELSTGKAAAQCGHAAQLAMEELVRRGDPATVRAWRDHGWRVDVVESDEEQWAALVSAPIHVVDAGFTEVDGPTETARAWWQA